MALATPEAPPSVALAALLETAEAAAATDTQPGAASLWALEEAKPSPPT